MLKLITRKLLSLIFKIHKKFYYSDNKSILINSIPKSGTHLADQIFKFLIEIKDFKYFIAQQPTRPHKLRNEKKIISMIKKIKNGELVRSHIHFNENVNKLLKQKNILMIFIYRDPRDIAISEAYYLNNMNKFHSAHKYFNRQKNHKDRLKLSIEGIKSSNIDYRNIGERIYPYIGWKNTNSSNIFAISYEEMISDIDTVLKKIYKFLVKNDFFKVDISFESFLKSSKEHINPNKSHTFREGKLSKWREEFDNDLHDLFNKNSNNILSKLGYK